MLDLSAKRILITQASVFMGPALVERFRACGADVVTDDGSLIGAGDPAALVAESGSLDALVVNLGMPAPSTPAAEADDREWEQVFRALVDPLPRLVRAVLPRMIERRRGKIVVMGSASALRGIRNASTYSAARGAQLAYVQAVGVEVARHNVQLNAIAQNFVDNPTYFPPQVQANPAFQRRLQREAPLGRLVSPEEDASLAAYLCSDAADCFVGQVFPMCGGWVAR